jgi:hypothetical protein
MKHIVIFFLIMLSIGGLEAQGNLQFNQALLFSGTTLNTVPPGKVWKIEHQAQSYSSSGSGLHSSLIINGVNWYLNGTSGSLPSGAIWLPGGTTVAGWGQYTNYNIIEFNLVP